MVTGWAATVVLSPQTQLAAVLGISTPDVEKALLRLETSGVILRGKFTESRQRRTEWCERRCWPASIALPSGNSKANRVRHLGGVYEWLFRWQHVVPSSQLLGERGLLEGLRQLQGYEAPANSWERQILARRVAKLRP